MPNLIPSLFLRTTRTKKEVHPVLACLAVPGSVSWTGFGRIDDRPHLIKVLHALLGEGRSDDVTRQIFHGRFIRRRYAVSAEEMEFCIFPSGEYPDHLLCNPSLGKKHPEFLLLKDEFLLFQIQGRGDTEQALVAAETVVRHQNVGVRIKSEEIAEGLHGDGGAGDGIKGTPCCKVSP